MLDHVVNGKAARLRFRYEMFCQFAQVPLPIAATRGFVWVRADKRADAPACLQNAGAFQFGVHLGHRIGVDAQIDGQLPYCRQLIPDAQLSSRNREANGSLQLRIKRRRVIGVDLEHRFTIVLRQ